MKKIITLSIFSLCTSLPLAAHANQDLTQREDVQAFVREISERNQLTPESVTAALSDAQYLPKVIDLIRPPSQPGVRSWQRYRPRFVNDQRISAGVAFWRAHENQLREAAALSGVPAEIIVGIIGVETVYGRNMGNFSALSALSTLAFDYPPRATLFRRELEELFLLARDAGVDVRDFKGSYAGALGQAQFLPSNIRTLAVDGDHDGKIDLSRSTADAIFSVANYLASHGWQRDAAIVLPAQINNESAAQVLVDAGIKPSLNASQLSQAGILSDLPLYSTEKVTLVDMISPGLPTEYWLGFQNFYVITRYNHSSFYAMSVHDLGMAVKQALSNHHTDQTLSRSAKKSSLRRKHAHPTH